MGCVLQLFSYLLNVRSAIISLFCIRLFKSIILYMNNHRVIVIPPGKYVQFDKKKQASLYMKFSDNLKL